MEEINNYGDNEVCGSVERLKRQVRENVVQERDPGRPARECPVFGKQVGFLFAKFPLLFKVIA